MRRYLGWLTIAWVLVIVAVLLFGYGAKSGATSLDSRVNSLAAQLRCPACQGESVADSNSDVAASIRGVIRQRMQQGESDQQITNFLESRYPGISLAPSTSGIGRLAWIAPPLLILGGLGLLAALVANWRSRSEREPVIVDQEYVRRVRSELAAGGGD